MIYIVAVARVNAVIEKNCFIYGKTYLFIMDNEKIFVTNDLFMCEEDFKALFDLKGKFDKSEYKDYIFEDTAFVFQRKFYNENIDCVQLINYDYGFCGSFEWKGNCIYPLDGDSYSNEIIGIGYEHFINKEGKQCLNLLVGDEW